MYAGAAQLVLSLGVSSSVLVSGMYAGEAQLSVRESGMYAGGAQLSVLESGAGAAQMSFVESSVGVGVVQLSACGCDMVSGVCRLRARPVTMSELVHVIGVSDAIGDGSGIGLGVDSDLEFGHLFGVADGRGGTTMCVDSCTGVGSEFGHVIDVEVEVAGESGSGFM